MKAEEILYNYDTDLYCDGAVYSESGYTSATVIKAMDEYAKERAIDFAKYLLTCKFEYKKLAELYDIFKNKNQEK